jgi:hypothetical protein
VKATKEVQAVYAIKRIALVVVLVGVAVAQSPPPPLSDSRLTVHTLLREDIFAGLLANDMDRFVRGEKNIQLLLEQRPDQKGNLLAWKASAALYRAVVAFENKQKDEFQEKYQLALDLFSEAAKVNSGSDGVAAIR